jgi:hypothetical protein
MTALKNMFYVLTLSYILIMFVNPALGISVSYGNNGVSSSSKYDLDISTTLDDVGILGDGTIYRTCQVSGSGDNEYSYQTSAKGSSAESAVKSSGVLSATTSTIASGEVAVLSQGVAGSGDLTAAISGSSGSVAADQNAGVVNGVLSTSQSLATNGDVVVASLNTQMTGDSGNIRSNALGQENIIQVSGDGVINGAINANLQAFASTRASVAGSVYDSENEILSQGDLQDVSSEENVGLSTSNLYYKNDLGITSFDTNAVNLKVSMVSASAFPPYIPPDKDSMTTGGAYKFMGYKWAYVDGYNPKIPLLVDTSNKGIGISGTAFGSVIYNAAMTWDSVSPKQLFGSIQSVGSVVPLTRNTKNEVGWKDLGSSTTLAATKSWNAIGTVLTGSNSRLSPTQWVTESDIAFNSNRIYTWTNQPRSSGSNPIDAQAVAVHELGHLLGMHHVTYDRAEIMYSTYPLGTGRSLGTGDKTGIKLLYA